jgi:GNAT superfamily N-acetyltransferase
VSTAYTLRPFTEADYEALAAVNNAAQPEYPRTPHEISEWDAKRDTKFLFARFVAVDRDGRVVGAAQYDQSPWMYHPCKFNVGADVTPEWQGRGVGRALYDRLLAELEPFEPITLYTMAREDAARAMRFYQDRGFEEKMRAYESRLDVAAFDPAPFAEARRRPEAEGIVIRSLAELRAADSDADRKVWALENTTAADVPGPEPFTPPPFETYERMVLRSENIVPEAFLIAIHEPTGEYVGSSNVWRRQADRDLNTGLTAVKREWRGKGIALAMKLRVVDWAKANGIVHIRTENEVNNRAMLSINERLGFAKVPPWVEMAKAVRPDTEADGQEAGASAAKGEA